MIHQAVVSLLVSVTACFFLSHLGLGIQTEIAIQFADEISYLNL